MRSASRRWLPGRATGQLPGIRGERGGRRSGREYITPLATLGLGEFVVLPLAFGEEADWFRNLFAAGRCTLRWRGRDWSLVDPVVIGWEEGSPALNPIQRLFIPIFGVRRFVRLRPA